MTQEKLLTVRDVSIILGVSEKEVLDLAESGAIPAYKIAGVYLRFKKEQVHEYRKSVKPHGGRHVSEKYSFKDRINDFLYFNDFYILSVLLVFLLLLVILRG